MWYKCRKRVKASQQPASGAPNDLGQRPTAPLSYQYPCCTKAVSDNTQQKCTLAEGQMNS